MVIELAQMHDLDAIETFFNAVNEAVQDLYYGPEWKKGIYPTRNNAEVNVKNKSLYIAKLKNQIIGSISLSHVQEPAYEQVHWKTNASAREILVVRLFAVHPDFTRRGVAQTMLTFAVNKAKALKSKTIRLDVVNQNIPACLLYEKSGFEYVTTVDLGLPYDKLKWFRLYEFVVQ